MISDVTDNQMGSLLTQKLLETDPLVKVEIKVSKKTNLDNDGHEIPNTESILYLSSHSNTENR